MGRPFGTTRQAIQLSQNKKDIIFLEGFKRDIGFTGPVRDACNNMRVVVIHSIAMREDLERMFNITTLKTLTLKPPVHLLGNDAFSFIAGYIDGDGWITLTRDKLTIGCQGTQAMLNWIAGFFDCYAPSPKKKAAMPFKRKSNCFQYVISGKRAERIMSIIQSMGLPVKSRKWSN